MSSFKYMGRYSNDIISAKLALVSISKLDDVTGVEREDKIGEQTIYRSVPNDYGTISKPLKFKYALIKEPIQGIEYYYEDYNYSVFSQEELIEIERWLTSPKYYSDLDIYDCEENYICTYNGKFISTKWILANGGFCAVEFEFQCSSSYPIIREEEKIELNGRTIEKQIYCRSDELEEYVYPVIHFKAEGSTVSATEKQYLTIKNESDNDNEVKIRVLENIDYIIDSKRLMVTQGNMINQSLATFEDLEWNDLSKIYFPRLIPNELNNLHITGNGTITISYDGVYKKVGGWL